MHPKMNDCRQPPYYLLPQLSPSPVPIITILVIIIINLQTTESLNNTPTIHDLKRLVTASSLSYLPLSSIPSSPYNKQIGGYTPVHQVIDPTTESGATIFRDVDDSNAIIVACRGSATPRNFATNLDFELVPATFLPDLPKGSKVHKGFQRAAYGLWNDVGLGDKLASVINGDAAGGDGRGGERSVSSVRFTGHSLGGATALLCAAYYASDARGGGEVTPPLSDVISFGGPRLCNGVLARHLSRNVLGTDSAAVLNLVHDDDPILANNRPLWDALGFEVVGRELQCEAKAETVYYGDDSDAEGRKSSLIPAWNILDHCWYLDTFVGPRVYRK